MPTRGMTLPFVVTNVLRGYFNSHAHEGHDRAKLPVKSTAYNFNSHAHEGHDVSQAQPTATKKISTHMPTRGMTGSTHSPSNLILNFNSHAHEGHDVRQQVLQEQGQISTHMPTRGMTKCDIIYI